MKLIAKETERLPITVEISPKEMDLILFALNRIGGAPTGPRGEADAIALFLSRQGALHIKSANGIVTNLPDTWEKAYA